MSTSEGRYTRICKVGEGTYGQVFKAQDKKTQRIVAIKTISLNSELEGVPSNAVREISLLKKLKHRNVVELLNVMYSQSRLSLVFEHCEQDLKQFLTRCRGHQDPNLAQTFMYQLLRGISYCHRELILHRDLKPSNILIDKHGILKLADFGLARPFGIPVTQFSPEVVTLWYRAPDVLLGAVQYDTSIDMWSVGCIFAEILTTRPLFPGSSPADQLVRIFECVGLPPSHEWPIERYPKYSLIAPHITSGRKFTYTLPDKLPRSPPQALDLISKLLQCRPEDRLSADEAMQHAFFQPFLDTLKKKKKKKSADTTLIADQQHTPESSSSQAHHDSRHEDGSLAQTGTVDDAGATDLHSLDVDDHQHDQGHDHHP
eukprot:m.185715 g.185715  ORF g.185715 m.185715 type:complete len:372 (-) comp16688_c1_seq8:301-1416(-)